MLPLTGSKACLASVASLLSLENEGGYGEFSL